MKTDVRTLLAALHEERRLIDRAITGLQALSEHGVAVERPATTRVQKARKGTRVRISDETKRRAIAAMEASSNRMATAKAIAREIGSSVSGIYTGWRGWRMQFDARSDTNGGQAQSSAAVDPAGDEAADRQ